MPPRRWIAALGLVVALAGAGLASPVARAAPLVSELLTLPPLPSLPLPSLPVPSLPLPSLPVITLPPLPTLPPVPTPPPIGTPIPSLPLPTIPVIEPTPSPATTGPPPTPVLSEASPSADSTPAPTASDSVPLTTSPRPSQESATPAVPPGVESGGSGGTVASGRLEGFVVPALAIGIPLIAVILVLLAQAAGAAALLPAVRRTLGSIGLRMPQEPMTDDEPDPALVERTS